MTASIIPADVQIKKKYKPAPHGESGDNVQPPTKKEFTHDSWQEKKNQFLQESDTRV